MGLIEAGVVKGIVKDADNGEEIIGATVFMKSQPARGAATGLDGSFALHINNNDFPQTIVVNYLGYRPTEVEARIADQDVEVLLKPEVVELSTVVVSAENQGKSDSSARLIEKLAGNVLNVVSAKAIEMSPDLTVANVVQRVSGVTVERGSSGDGQYAILRGMDKRYNYTLVNGVKIPSPDNKNRFVPLDIFPSELLDRLEVTKALTADMEADAVGGAINMVMKDAPREMQLTVNLATGYNALFFDHDFKYFDRTAITAVSPFEKYGEGYPAKVQDFSTKNLILESEKAKPSIFGGFSFGNQFFNEKLGVIAALSYQNSYRGNNSLDFDFVTASNNASNLPVLTKKNDRFYSEQQTRLGAHLKLDYELGNHKFQWYNAYMDFGNQQVREIATIDLSLDYKPHEGNYSLSQDTRMRWNRQQIINSTLKGEHSFGSLGIDWSGVWSQAQNETPDNMFVYLASRVNHFTPNPLSVVSSSGGSGGIKRRWEHNSDEDLAGYLNFKYKIQAGEADINLSAGGMYRDKQRTSFYNQYNFNPYDPAKPEGQQKNLIQGSDWQTFDQIKLSLENPHGSTGDPLNYDASEKIGAGYVQGKVEINQVLVTLGVRAENTAQGYVLKHPVAGVTSDSTQRYTDILPSLHLRYSPHKDMNLRASYYKSINRPSFFEIVPYRIINEEYQERGNPNLNHAVAHNVDLRYEYFPRPSEQWMAGVFYKNIENPIEMGIFSEGQNTYYMPSNYGTANNYGAEIDVTKYFRWFGVKANYTYTHSQILTQKVKNIENPDPSAPDRIKQIFVEQNRPLNNQAAHVTNLSLLVKENGWDGQLAFSYTGERLYAISRFQDNDIWLAGFMQTDVSIEKSFKMGLSIYAKASNLLNAPMVRFLKKQNSLNENILEYETFGNGTLIRRDYFGQTFQIGLRYKL
ncbi:TonB-dependent receptor [Bacteroidia bacterium]|nr:TonB-dependent receptor [Bacteroidia bacterium]